MIYLDSSAAVKLVRRELETDALRARIGANPQPMVSSVLVRTEVSRALIRTDPSALPNLRMVIATINQVPITDAVLDAAAAMPEPALRSLDAIHLATAMHLSPSWFATYDKRLVEAARCRGLRVLSPQ
ncbi:MAG TPA: type II toxin-antitoxin system VapC family toxin [Mycobacteriales bacterium]|nr:type II toxin-antitoxin system VapC family toxin [Mycobacteriales bacterium]